MVRIHEWLKRHQFPPAVATAILRLHAMPKLSLRIGSVTMDTGRRTRGALTGTRTAGLVGTIPVESSIAACSGRWHGRGFCAETRGFYCMACVDN
eukprot:954426-Alexandrium_andersonii.AAC.1